MGALHENIKELRKLHGLNQVELASALSVSKQCVSNWENDNILPSIEMLIKIADFFGVSTDKLLGREATDTVDTSKLTPEQRTHIRMIVKDLSENNTDK